MEPVEYREERVVTPAPAAVTPVTPVAAQPVATGAVSRVYPVGYRAIQLVWFVVGLINAVLAFDFVLRLAAANDVGFAHFIYALGRVFAAPFDGIFNITVADGVYVARWSDLLAIAVYSLIGWGITKLVRIMATPRGPAVV
jgi:hypothetical protein